MIILFMYKQIKEGKKLYYYFINISRKKLHHISCFIKSLVKKRLGFIMHVLYVYILRNQHGQHG